MPKPLIEDGLWERIEPLLPKKRRRKRFPARLPLENRRVLTGILFVLRSGIPWEMLPKERGCGSGMTCLLMALLFAGGVMNLAWVAAIAVFVLLEKSALLGSRAGRLVSGWALIGSGSAVLLMGAGRLG